MKELTNKKRGIIVCGEIHDERFADAVIELAEKLAFPILADPLSQLRTNHNQSHVIDCYDTFLRMDEAVTTFNPDIIIRFGAMPVSKALMLYMKKCKDVPYIVVDETAFCRSLAMKLPKEEHKDWYKQWERVNDQTKRGLLTIQGETAMDEGKVFVELCSLLPKHANLFVANSMPIRDCDTFFHNNGTSCNIYANRGANGIDGVVSTALGVSTTGNPTVLVIGDLSFYHDMNGLLAAKMLDLNITIIVINNDGGGIFSFLPQSKEKDCFEELFGTPHGLDFSHAVEMYRGRFTRVESWPHFEEALQDSFKEPGLKVIEVVTNRADNVNKHRKLWSDVSQEIHCLLAGESNED